MLTEKQYQALCKYRDSFVPASGKSDDMTLDLHSRGFIRIKKVEYAKTDECVVFYQKAFWELTALGNDELRTYEIAEKQSQHKSRMELIGTIVGIISAIAAIVGAVFAVLTFFL